MPAVSFDVTHCMTRAEKRTAHVSRASLTRSPPVKGNRRRVMEELAVAIAAHQTHPSWLTIESHQDG